MSDAVVNAFVVTCEEHGREHKLAVADAQPDTVVLRLARVRRRADVGAVRTEDPKTEWNELAARWRDCVRTCEDDLLAPASSMVALYRERLSYRPEEAMKLIPLARYFQVYVFRTGPGTEMDFAEVIRIRKLAFDTMNLDRPEMGYQVISGAMWGTYLFLAPLQSLRAIDNGIARLPVYAESFSGVARQARQQITAEAGITREQFIFRVEPGMSYVSESFAAGDPEFWLKR